MREKIQEFCDCAVRDLLNSESGRWFLWMLLNATGVLRASYSTNPQDMAFREGQRDIGLVILRGILQAADEEALAKILALKPESLDNDE